MRIYPHYALPNVVLANGYELFEEDGEEVVSFEDVEGLESSIRQCLLVWPAALTGDQIRYLRKSAELTQDQLAVMAGVNQQTVARWEKGQTKPTALEDRALRLTFAEIFAPEITASDFARLRAQPAPEQLVFERAEGVWVCSSFQVKSRAISILASAQNYVIGGAPVLYSGRAVPVHEALQLTNVLYLDVYAEATGVMVLPAASQVLTPAGKQLTFATGTSGPPVTPESWIMSADDGRPAH